MREEDSNLECGIVYEQILINAKLQIGKRGQKNTADWKESIKEARSCIWTVVPPTKKKMNES
jgi:hypothetical protein